MSLPREMTTATSDEQGLKATTMARMGPTIVGAAESSRRPPPASQFNRNGNGSAQAATLQLGGLCAELDFGFASIMAMVLLPAISSNVASFKLSVSSPLLRNLVSCEIAGFCNRRVEPWWGRKNRSSPVRRMAAAAVDGNLASTGLREMERAATMSKPKVPVLLLDVMGTLVRDPFYEDIPAFFGMTMKELLAEKHPTCWIEFEMGQLTEEEVIKKFFADGRDFDIQGLKECMTKGYTYLEGVEELLQRLLSAGYTMHAFSNYPCWYSMIEDKLQLSQYMPWTFVSCHMGLRKPDLEIYLEAARQLKLDPSDCVFVDDRSKNVEAAMAVGMKGVVFRNAKQLEEELAAQGCCL